MDLDPLHKDFLRITASIMYCIVTTVDPEGHHHSRVVHQIFEVIGRHPGGCGCDQPDAAERPPYRRDPYVRVPRSWSPAQDKITMDSAPPSGLRTDSMLRRVWDLFAAPAPPGSRRPEGLWQDQGGLDPASTSSGWSGLPGPDLARRTSAPAVDESRHDRGRVPVDRR